MNKIFVVSLHRSGTQSIHDLFVRSGLSAVHWPAVVHGVNYQSQVVGREDDVNFIADVLAPVIDRVMAVSDVPIPALYEALDKRYPGARFIAVHRRPDEWVRSVRRHIGDRSLDPFERALYFRYLPGRPDRMVCISDVELSEVHKQHYEALTAHFSGRSNFGFFELDDQKLGEQICAFLGLPVVQLRPVDYLAADRRS